MERVFATYMARKASRLLGRVADIPLPRTILSPLVHAYSIGVGANAREWLEPSGGWESFGDFFARRLRPESRPICQDRDALVSPCDGAVRGLGDVDAGDRTELCVKGSTYDVGALLGDKEAGRAFRGGGFMVIYLHPRDYHRVHAPADGVLAAVRHVPGARYPVNAWAERRVSGVYGKNERMVFHMRTEGGLDLAIVMVAAFGVGNIETSFMAGAAGDGDVVKERRCMPPAPLTRGDELGAFRLGSTVVLLWAKGAVEVDPSAAVGLVSMGRRLGRTGARTGPKAGSRS
ncbi:MAG: archaetidylserine decarboxylase [Deltaproteobacteria bacterium]|nr:archaetidylserine decarboxylase [Deltaproteobacteria bacterium]